MRNGKWEKIKPINHVDFLKLITIYKDLFIIFKLYT